MRRDWLFLTVTLLILVIVGLSACGGGVAPTAPAQPTTAPTAASTQPPTPIPGPTMEMGGGAGTGAACDQSQKNPFQWTDASAVEAGKTIYNSNCQACHGPDGKGVIQGAPDFSTMKDEITNEPGEHLCTIINGEGTMPSWKDKLTVEQMWQALTYIASLAK